MGRTDLIKVVLEDLNYLKDYWDHSIDDAGLRITSPILRRLLVEGKLQKAWKIAGFEKQPKFIAITLSPLLEKFPIEGLDLASAGGAETSPGCCSFGIHYLDLDKILGLGRDIEGLVSDGKLIPEGFVGTVNNQPKESEFTLQEFCESTCLVVKGNRITRRIMIKYVANKCGGVHFDTKRDDKNAYLFKKLDKVNENYLNRDFIYFELLSTAQVLLRSDDIKRFMVKFQ